MSYLSNLLAQSEPLEPHERADLSTWLAVIEDDCAVFGETAEDLARMSAIRAKLAES